MSAAPPALLEVRGLSTHFATRAGVLKAVDDLSFRVHAGEIIGLVGESGSGKSVTGFSILMPERRAEVMGMVWKALIAGFLATCMTAAVVGCMPPWIFGQ